MARLARRRLGAGILCVLLLFLGGACAYTYAPNAEGTPVLVLRASLTPTPAAPALEPTPRPTLRRLTAPGCCGNIWWSADGTQVLYVDKPDEQPAAIWGVDAAKVGVAATSEAAATGEAAPYSDVVGVLQHHDRYVIALVPQTPYSVTVHDRQTGESWPLHGVGSLPFIAPDGARVAYDGRMSQQTLFATGRQTTLVVAALDGSDPQHLAMLYGVGIVAWFPDGTRLLALGKQNPGDARAALWQVDAETGALAQLDDGAHLRNISLSPDGAWLVYLKAFEQDPGRNTTWALHVRTGERRRLLFAGRYAWVGSEDATLVYVPPRRAPGQGFSVWKLDVASGERARLVDPAQTPLFIANGDWALSPDGTRLAFVSAEDYAIWLLVMSP